MKGVGYLKGVKNIIRNIKQKLSGKRTVNGRGLQKLKKVGLDRFNNL